MMSPDFFRIFVLLVQVITLVTLHIANSVIIQFIAELAHSSHLSAALLSGVQVSLITGTVNILSNNPREKTK